MSQLKHLIDQAIKNKGIQDAFAQFPVEIWKDCGINEVEDTILQLDKLALAKLNPENEEETAGIWRAQNSYSSLLEKLSERYLDEVLAGLKSKYEETRFWISHVFMNAPNAKALKPINEYLQNDMPDHSLAVANAAFQACKKKQSIFRRLLG